LEIGRRECGFNSAWQEKIIFVSLKKVEKEINNYKA
jgi:hypothetical protein